MELSSEQVHWIGGFAFTAVAALLLLRSIRHWNGPAWGYLLPALFMGYGLESLVDVWVHGQAVPPGYARESRQHLVQGGALLLAGTVELLIERRVLRAWAWRLAAPAALGVLALGFLFHAQHGLSEVAMAMMSAEHRGFAIALGVAAGARTLDVWWARNAGADARRSPFADAWLMPLLVFGMLMLTYREAME
jgi:hypothetical protein